MERCDNCKAQTDDVAVVKSVWVKVLRGNNSASYVHGREEIIRVKICPKCAIDKLREDRFHTLKIVIPIVLLLIPIFALIMHYINIDKTENVTVTKLFDIQHFLTTPQFYPWLFGSAFALLIFLVILIVMVKDMIILPQKAVEQILTEKFYGLSKKRLPKLSDPLSNNEYMLKSSHLFVEKYFSDDLRAKN